MQTLSAPCSGQVFFSQTLEAIPPVRQTSAGQLAWQIAHREVVRLSSSSASVTRDVFIKLKRSLE
jgi:hypothetical protein